MLTFIGESIAVGSGGGGSVAGFDFQGVGRLLFAIEDDLGEDLARLLVDLEIVLALVTRRVNNPVINLQQHPTINNIQIWIVITRAIFFLLYFDKKSLFFVKTVRF